MIQSHYMASALLHCRRTFRRRQFTCALGLKAHHLDEISVVIDVHVQSLLQVDRLPITSKPASQLMAAQLRTVPSIIILLLLLYDYIAMEMFRTLCAARHSAYQVFPWGWRPTQHKINKIRSPIHIVDRYLLLRLLALIISNLSYTISRPSTTAI